VSDEKEADAWVARLRLHPTVFVAPGAIVVGDVTIGARSSVWFQTVVRGDSDRVEIGEDTNLQELTLVHQDEGLPAVVGSRVTIGHHAVVHGCVIEDECLIGMGAVLLSGARIGAGSLVAAGALVREGQVIPPRSLVVGSPARVLGEVKPAHEEAIHRGFTHYAELARSYQRRGFARPHPRTDSDIGTAAPWRGPMGHAEWRGLVATLEEGPRVAAGWAARHDAQAWSRRPDAERWSAVELLAHLRDVDREIYAPRVERLLSETEPEIADVPVETWARERGYAGEDRAAALDGWSAARSALVVRLAPLGPAEWARFAWHSARGPFPLGEMVRRWVEHDLSRCRQIALALGERA
jgi:carbonic anhydrase/acetyltransferase-like protein (isoleucine patch superfamily)